MSHKIAFLFPGQGSQKVGMTREWTAAFPEARHALEEADDALGFHLGRLIDRGPEEELNLTANTQPAILASSIALLRVVEKAGIGAAAAAGHSLGEYSALVACGSLDFPGALELVRSRGRFMQEAVPVGDGAMAAIMGLDAAAVRRITEEARRGREVCAVANYNSPLQTVISGHAASVERGVALAAERGAKKAKILPVSAPFHSPLMQPAREALEPLLEQAEFADPEPPVVCNIDAEPVCRGAAARDALARQVDGPVRWTESIERLVVDGIEVFVEVGPGNVLSGLGKRISRDVRWASLPKPQALEKLVAEL